MKSRDTFFSLSGLKDLDLDRRHFSVRFLLVTGAEGGGEEKMAWHDCTDDEEE